MLVRILRFSSQYKSYLNYFGSNFAVKAISFISIPIFTRVLTPADYGLLNLFTTYVGFFVILLTLNLHSSIGRYYFERIDEHEDYE